MQNIQSNFQVVEDIRFIQQCHEAHRSHHHQPQHAGDHQLGLQQAGQDHHQLLPLLPPAGVEPVAQLPGDAVPHVHDHVPLLPGHLGPEQQPLGVRPQPVLAILLVTPISSHCQTIAGNQKIILILNL